MTTTLSPALARQAASWRTGFPRSRRSRVLLLEAGGRDWNPWIHVPVGYFKTCTIPRTRLVLQDGSRPGPERAQHRLAARQDPGRLQLDQRPALHPRPARGLRPLAPARQRRLVRRGRAALLQARRRPGAGRRRLPRAGGPLSVSDMRVHRDVCNAFHRRRPRNWAFRATTISTAPESGRRRLLPADLAPRPALLDRGRLPQSVRRRPNLEIVTHAHVESDFCSTRERAERAVSGIAFNVKGGRDAKRA